LSLIPGRIRLNLPGCTANDVGQIETLLYRVKGIKSVQANRLTGNVLIHFDLSTSDEQRLLAKLQEAWSELFGVLSVTLAARGGTRKPVGGQSGSTSSLLRVGVRGLLGHAIVDSLWFGAGFLGSAFGLPLAGLGPLHVLTDIAVWGIALGSGTGGPTTRPVTP
jgi:hypothetical protein